MNIHSINISHDPQAVQLLTPECLLQVTTLKAAHCQLKSLQFLKACSKLRELDLRYNQIEDRGQLSFIGNSFSVIEIDLTGNPIDNYLSYHQLKNIFTNLRTYNGNYFHNHKEKSLKLLIKQMNVLGKGLRKLVSKENCYNAQLTNQEYGRNKGTEYQKNTEQNDSKVESDDDSISDGDLFQLRRTLPTNKQIYCCSDPCSQNEEKGALNIQDNNMFMTSFQNIAFTKSVTKPQKGKIKNKQNLNLNCKSFNKHKGNGNNSTKNYTNNNPNPGKQKSLKLHLNTSDINEQHSKKIGQPTATFALQREIQKDGEIMFKHRKQHKPSNSIEQQLWENSQVTQRCQRTSLGRGGKQYRSVYNMGMSQIQISRISCNSRARRGSREDSSFELGEQCPMKYSQIYTQQEVNAVAEAFYMQALMQKALRGFGIYAQGKANMPRKQAYF